MSSALALLFATSFGAAQGGYGYPGSGGDGGGGGASGGGGGSGSGTAGAGGGSAQGPQGGGGGGVPMILIAHIVCGALATLLFLPLGILIPRYARAFTAKRWWWPAHSAIMGLLAFGCAVAAMSIARTRLKGMYDSLHGKLALATLCLISFQILLGIFVHFVKIKAPKVQTATGRGPSNFLHIFIGWTTVGVGFATAYQGMTSKWNQISPIPVPNGYIAGYGVIVGFTSLAYLAGLLLVPRQLRLAQEANERDGISEGQTITAPRTKDAQ